MRDLTDKQFFAALERHGIRTDYLGYYDVGSGVLVYGRNAGPRRRDQLAYLLRQQQRHAAKQTQAEAPAHA